MIQQFWIIIWRKQNTYIGRCMHTKFTAALSTEGHGRLRVTRTTSLCTLVKTHGSVHLLSRVQLFVTPWTVACQAPLSTWASRQESWSSCHFLLQGIFLIQRLRLHLLHLLHWQPDSSPLSHLKTHGTGHQKGWYLLHVDYALIKNKNKLLFIFQNFAFLWICTGIWI